MRCGWRSAAPASRRRPSASSGRCRGRTDRARRAAGPRTRAPPAIARSRGRRAHLRPQLRGSDLRRGSGRSLLSEPVAHQALGTRAASGVSSGAHARARTTPRTAVPRDSRSSTDAVSGGPPETGRRPRPRARPMAVRRRGRARSGRRTSLAARVPDDAVAAQLPGVDDAVLAAREHGGVRARAAWAAIGRRARPTALPRSGGVRRVPGSRTSRAAVPRRSRAGRTAGDT